MTKEEILAIRKSMGFSQERFADLIGTTLTTVCRWERGKATPRMFHLSSLLRIKVTQDYIARFQANKWMLVR